MTCTFQSLKDDGAPYEPLPFREAGQRLWNSGYRGAVPVAPNSKAAGRGWNLAGQWSAEYYDSLYEACPDHSTGIIAGCGITAIDVDCTDEWASKRCYQILVKHCGETQFIRVGSFPKFVLVYRDDTTTFRKNPYGFPIEVFGGKPTFERVDGKQLHKAKGQFIVEGMHPKTGRPYRWPFQRLVESKLQDLPVMDPAGLEAALLEMRSDPELREALQRASTCGGAVDIDGTGISIKTAADIYQAGEAGLVAEVDSGVSALKRWMAIAEEGTRHYTLYSAMAFLHGIDFCQAYFGGRHPAELTAEEFRERSSVIAEVEAAFLAAKPGAESEFERVRESVERIIEEPIIAERQALLADFDDEHTHESSREALRDTESFSEGENSGSMPQSEGEAGEKPKRAHPLLDFRERNTLPPAESFLIRDVLTDKLSVLASYPGKGKTSAWVSIAAVVAGAIEVPGLVIDAPRHIIYASEHPEQVERILLALRHHFTVDQKALDERFHVVDSQRMTASKLVLAATELLELSVPVTRNSKTVELSPYVVLDTASANLDIEDENDNSRWGEVIATVKERFADIPTTIIAHTSKEHKRGEAKRMTVRGASAIEGDVNQVLFLSDNDEGERFVEVQAGKHRFDTHINALQLNPKTSLIPAENRWGELVEQRILVVGLEPLTSDERKRIETEAKEAAADARKEERLSRAIDALRQWFKTNPGEYPSLRQLQEEFSEGSETRLSRDSVRQAVQELKKRGSLTEETPPADLKTPGRNHYLAASIEFLEQF